MFSFLSVSNARILGNIWHEIRIILIQSSRFRLQIPLTLSLLVSLGVSSDFSSLVYLFFSVWCGVMYSRTIKIFTCHAYRISNEFQIALRWSYANCFTCSVFTALLLPFHAVVFVRPSVNGCVCMCISIEVAMPTKYAAQKVMHMYMKTSDSI